MCCRTSFYKTHDFYISKLSWAETRIHELTCSVPDLQALEGTGVTGRECYAATLGKARNEKDSMYIFA